MNTLKAAILLAMVLMDVPCDPGYPMDRHTCEMLANASLEVRHEFKRLTHVSGWLASDESITCSNDEFFIAGAAILRGRAVRKPWPGDPKLIEYYKKQKQ